MSEETTNEQQNDATIPEGMPESLKYSQENLKKEIEALQKEKEETVARANADPEDLEIEKTIANEDVDPAERTMAKRYGDLRRHQQKEKETYEDTIAELKSQLAESKAKEFAAENTYDQDKLNEFKENQPDVYANIVELARQQAEKMAEQRIAPVQAELEKATKARQKVEYEQRLSQVREVHPDLDKLSSDNDFLSWLEEQDTIIFDSFTKGKNPKTAITILNAYKAEKGLLSFPSKKETKTKKEDDAANVVNTRKSTKPSDLNTKKKEQNFTREDVANMSLTDFKKYKDQILRDRIGNNKF